MTRSWDGVHALVVGIGVAGYAAATGLLNVGARVTVLDDRDSDPNREKATIVEALGGVVRLGAGTTTGDPAALLAGVDLVVVTPGLPPTAALPVAARSAGIDVLGEVDLAWRLRGVVAGEDKAAAWIGLTGTNGKTTTVEMLASMLRAGGLRAEAVGNIGLPVTDAVLDPQPHDVLAVELSSHQLYWSGGLALRAAAVLNIEDDHLEWHGSAAAYATAKGKIYEGCQVACVYNPAYPVTEELVRAADVQEECRAIGFTTGVPAAGMVGVVDGVIADRAFVENRATSAAELVRLDELPSTAPHNVANAVAAATLARAHGVRPEAVRNGLRSYRIGAHRVEHVRQVDGVAYVDDSKATNAHAANASLQAYDPVVWVAGGEAKGQTFDSLVTQVRDRLRAAVLLGVDRDVIRDALERHAPDVPVVEVPGTDTGVMDRVVEQAAALARPGDTVLLAPGCASRDIFADYAQRGAAFAAAAGRLDQRQE